MFADSQATTIAVWITMNSQLPIEPGDAVGDPGTERRGLEHLLIYGMPIGWASR